LRTYLGYTLSALLSFGMSAAYADTASSAAINFNVGHSPVAGLTTQPVTLFGCNNTVFKSQLVWGVENQVVTHIPYGLFKSKSGKSYAVSKYYIASPEVAHAQSGTDAVYIGLVTPDSITFHGTKPTSIVNLDYRILHPVYLANVPVDFNYKYQGKSCAEMDVTSIPINTECDDFPWENGGLGASGIGLLSTHPASTAFLLTREKDKDPLQCRVTLLNDIMLNHKVFFATKDGMASTIDLTTLYKEKKPMHLICIPRKIDDIPTGCAPFRS
jgi:hypothetical protein